MKSVLKTLGFSVAVFLFILGSIVLTVRLFPPFGGTIHLYILSYLEFLEKMGLPTLTGSDSGWPIWTLTGSLAVYFSIFLLSLVLVTIYLRIRKTKPNNSVEATA